MRNHGIVGFPDPVVSGDNVNVPIPQGMNTKSTQFLRAREICELLIPPVCLTARQPRAASSRDVLVGAGI